MDDKYYILSTGLMINRKEITWRELRSALTALRVESLEDYDQLRLNATQFRWLARAVERCQQVVDTLERKHRRGHAIRSRKVRLHADVVPEPAVPRH